MLNMILKDLRISPLRNILTGISMFVGIIAMISSVLVGTLGKEYLISVNAQMYGWSPTYSFSITGSDFQDTIKMENFFREIYNTDHFVAVTFSMLEEITVAPVASVSSLQDISDTVYKKTVPVDVVFTTSTYNKIYNLPMSSGDWFDSSEINKTLCMVVNKAAQNYFDTSYAVGNVESSLSLTPFNVVGTVNDGTDIPTVYLDAHSIELLVPNVWKVKNATVHWHSEAGITMRQMYSSLHDILEDTIGGNLDIIGKSDIGDTYNSVLSVLQLGLLVTSFLLLFVSVLGQINIKEEERQIYLEMMLKVDNLFILIKNPCMEQSLMKKGGHFLTTKNEEGHGMGLLSVKRAVEECQGSIYTNVENGIFQASVMLPRVENKTDQEEN